MATIKDVARQAGVSISTVSRVINHSAPVIEAKYQAVNRAMLMLNYQPNAHAQALVRRYSNTIGFMMGDIAFPQCGTILQAVESVVTAENKRVVISCGQHYSREEEYQSLEKLLIGSCDAFIIQASYLTDAELVKLLRYRPSAILLGRRVSVLAEQCVYPDYMRAGFRAAQYLTDLGHKKIVFIGGQGSSANRRLLSEGYRLAFREKGLTVSPALLQENANSKEDGYVATQRLLEKSPNFTGLICSNDIIASGALKALQAFGKRVPQQVSVMACEDTGIADYLLPALTTVRFPIEAMAKYAAKLALTRVQQEGYTSLELPENGHGRPFLTVRDSVMAMVYNEFLD